MIISATILLKGCNDKNGGWVDSFSISDVAIDDLDMDGTKDIVINARYCCGDNSRNFISVFLNDFDFPGSIGLSQEFVLNPFHTIVVKIGDLNHDGFSDIAIGGSEGILVSFQDSVSPGQFFTPVEVLANQFVSEMLIGDLNQDGFNDIAIPGVRVLFQDSFDPGKFFPLVELGNFGGSFDIGDLDGDLINDLAVTNGSSVKVLLQNPGIPGDFSISTTIATASVTEDIKINDLNQDGKLDIVVSNRGPSGAKYAGSASVLLQDQFNAGQFSPAVTYVTGCYSDTVRIGDLNHDGFSDIATTGNCKDDAVTIHFQDISDPGAFLSPVKYFTPNDSGGVEIDDMNNNNYNDLIIFSTAQDGVMIGYQNSVIPGSFMDKTVIYDPD